MKTKLMLTCVVVALSLPLFACSSRQAALEITYDHFMEYKHFTWEVKVNTGDTVTVTLYSNPTTGFRWSELVKISNQTVLKQTDHRYAPAEERNIVGGAGQEVWTFKALNKGTTTVSMEYSQPWEGGEKGEWTFIATIIVE